MFQSWDIVAVPFPFTEGEGEKRRPALIISTRGLAKSHDLYWLLMITSAKNKPWPGDVAIDNHMEAGLPAPSVVRVAKLTTLQGDKLLKKLGHLNNAQQATVKKRLAGYLA